MNINTGQGVFLQLFIVKQSGKSEFEVTQHCVWFSGTVSLFDKVLLCGNSQTKA